MAANRCVHLMVGAAALAWAGFADAQTRSRAVPVDRNVTQDDVVLKLDVQRVSTQRAATRVSDGDSLRLNDHVVVCFEATRDGFVTLWSVDATGNFALIYPNAFSHAGKDARAERVRKGDRSCVGENDKFKLQVQRPLGASKVYLHWTRTEDEQLGMDDYPAIGRNIARGTETYASQTVEYRVVE